MKAKAKTKAVTQPGKEPSQPSFEKWVRGIPKLEPRDRKEVIRVPLVLSMPFYDWMDTVRAAVQNGMAVEEFIGGLINEEVTDYVNCDKRIPGGAQ